MCYKKSTGIKKIGLFFIFINWKINWIMDGTGEILIKTMMKNRQLVASNGKCVNTWQRIAFEQIYFWLYCYQQLAQVVIAKLYFRVNGLGERAVIKQAGSTNSKISYKWYQPKMGYIAVFNIKFLIWVAKYSPFSIQFVVIQRKIHAIKSHYLHLLSWYHQYSVSFHNHNITHILFHLYFLLGSG